MPNNVYYVFDDKLCKYEGMTKEQIYNAIAEATGATPASVDDGFISTIVETHNNRSMHLWKGTSAEYAQLQTIDPDTFYIISDDTTIDDMEAEIADINVRMNNLVSSIFWCDNNTTAAEVATALASNRIPIYVHVFPPIGSIPSYTISYMYAGTNSLGHYEFTRAYGNKIFYADLNPNNNNWSTSSLQIEITSNKVTSISSSSTDAQYPSAKAVYDAIEAGAAVASTETYFAESQNVSSGSNVTPSSLVYDKFGRYFVDIKGSSIYSSELTTRVFLTPSDSSMRTFYGTALDSDTYLGEIAVSLTKVSSTAYKYEAVVRGASGESADTLLKVKNDTTWTACSAKLINFGVLQFETESDHVFMTLQQSE